MKRDGIFLQSPAFQNVYVLPFIALMFCGAVTACNNGDLSVYPEDCTAYLECCGGQLIKKECPTGNYYDPNSQKCIPDDNGVCIPTVKPPCTEGEVSVDPENCNAYLKCCGGQLIKKECPTGNYYDPNSQKCIPDDNGVCVPTVKPPCTEGEVSVDPEDCTAYLKCSGGQLIKTECPTGNYFNKDSLKCIPDDNGVCIPTEKPPCTEGEVSVDPEDCTAYLKCSGGQLIKTECPTGNYFNKDSLKCIPDDNGVCIPTEKPLCKEGEVSVDSQDCSAYLQCVGGQLIKKQCPTGNYFEPTSQKCIPDDNGVCKPTVPTPPAGPSGTSCDNPGVCLNQPDGTKFADPNSNGYIVCQCGCPIDMPCDKGLVFNQTAQVCDWPEGSHTNPETVNCPGNLIYNPETGECDFPPGYIPEVQCNTTTTICVGQPEGTLFPVEGVCNKFYKCNYNCAVEIICPNNLLYSQKYLMCDYPENVDCPYPYTPPSGPTAGPSGTSCESGGRCVGQRDGTLLSSNISCSQYIVCQCECEVPMKCDSSLWWNSKLEVCDYPENVTCSLN